MYNKLYGIWKKEKKTAEIQALPKEFFAELAEYIEKMKNESRMLDAKTVRAKLLRRESGNAKKMIKDLIQLRYEKSLKSLINGKIIAKEALTREEEKLLEQVSPLLEAFPGLLKDILSGRQPQLEFDKKTQSMILRFTQEVPAIIGADMKTHGPFKPEDVASLPVGNARILVRQGVAVELDTRAAH